MDTKIIDANVIIKWYVDESDSELALSIRDQFINHELDLIVPPLLYFEVLNGLKYTGEFTKEELNIVAESLENYGFNIILPKNEIRLKMIEIAMDYEITIYDAAYVALAIEKKTQLYTADEKIKKKLPNELKQYILNLSETKSH